MTVGELVCFLCYWRNKVNVEALFSLAFHSHPLKKTVVIHLLSGNQPIGLPSTHRIIRQQWLFTTCLLCAGECLRHLAETTFYLIRRATQ